MINNYCVCCGKIIPEGRQVCLDCEDRDYRERVMRERIEKDNYINLIANDVCNSGHICSLLEWEDCEKRCGNCPTAKLIAVHLYNIGYRKIPNGGVIVISKEHYHELMKNKENKNEK